MPYKDKEKRKEYYQRHKEKYNAYGKSYREKHKEKIREIQKANYQRHKDERAAYQKTYRKTHKEENNSYQNNYRKIGINTSGVKKASIRCMSNDYLFNKIKHSKLKGYEIHHCFGYENHKCFVYIPKKLHLQIHQFLRDNKISADSNHFSQIVHLINDWDGYTYIKV